MQTLEAHGAKAEKCDQVCHLAGVEVIQTPDDKALVCRYF